MKRVTLRVIFNELVAHKNTIDVHATASTLPAAICAAVRQAFKDPSVHGKHVKSGKMIFSSTGVCTSAHMGINHEKCNEEQEDN